ncbi:putative protein kinase RLK-Pelle-WAK-LRK10L-1 family [Helianthus annuus]|nr:putative protein kinase RLK-Pelle-WAK-LRK10L-1 family [Helianthus annuus]
MNTLTFPSPSPLLYSISINPNITLFKCTKNLPYFDQHSYNSYNKRCKDHNFYYNYFNGTVPSDLPHTCQLVQLPKKLSLDPGLDETNIFSLLSSNTSIFFNVSHACTECQTKGLLCDTENGRDVQCFEVKKGIYSFIFSFPSSVIFTLYWVDETNILFGCCRKTRVWYFLALVISGSTLILPLSFLIFIIWCLCKGNPFCCVSSKNKFIHLNDISLSCGVISLFSYKELKDATQNFNPSHELGDGGKLKDGREVAAKKLHEHKYNRVQQFRNEVEILTKLRHPNLVVLYGCRELLLVYEYVPNGNVADHLHGEQENPYLLTWPIRMNIAIETASALVYLHTSEIIHRDVKTTNILLDHNFCVKAADFGLSRLIPNNVTHVSTAPQGTAGYVDPQYHQRYQLTEKSDVYSFRVVLIFCWCTCVCTLSVFGHDVKRCLVSHVSLTKSTILLV